MTRPHADCTRRGFLARCGAGLAGAGLGLMGAPRPLFAESDRRRSVLLILIDDLRCDLGCYGGPALTPHLDALAKRAVRFDAAYCTDLNDPAISTMPDAAPLPLHFADQGFAVSGIGPMHGVIADDSIAPWAERFALPEKFHLKVLDDRALSRIEPHDDERSLLHWGPSDRTLDTEPDGLLTRRAVFRIHNLSDPPELTILGLNRPTDPLTTPRAFYDLYDPDAIELPPTFGHTQDDRLSRVLRQLSPFAEAIDDPSVARELRRAYFACVSLIDACVGRVLSALEESGRAAHTAVVVAGRRGTALGEHDLWHRGGLFEPMCRTPLLIASPGETDGGWVHDSPVPFDRLYATACALAGIDPPPLLTDRTRLPIGQTPRRLDPDAAVITRHTLRDGRMTGRSIRDARWRYTRWQHRKPFFNIPPLVELYDHQSDPHEQTNLMLGELDANAAEAQRRLGAALEA